MSKWAFFLYFIFNCKVSSIRIILLMSSIRRKIYTFLQFITRRDCYSGEIVYVVEE